MYLFVIKRIGNPLDRNDWLIWARFNRMCRVMLGMELGNNFFLGF
jgi:hypothetical protein